MRAISGNPRWASVTVLVWALYLSGMIYTLVLAPVFAAPSRGTGPAVLGLSLIGVVGSWQAGRLIHLDRRSRRAWQVMSVGLLLLLGSGILFTAMPHSEVFPSPGDALRLASMATLLTALHLFPLRSGDRPERLKLGLDAAIVLASGSVTIWYFVLAPHLRNDEAMPLLLASSTYPIIDLILHFSALRLLVRGANPSTRVSAQLLAGGLLLLALVDTYQSYREAVAPGTQRGTTVELVTLLTTFLLLALASLEQRRHADRPTPLSTSRGAGISWAPYAAVVLSCALMAAETIRHQGLSRLGGLIIGTTVIVALVLFRQLLTQRENQTLATTDRLTGVANRVRIDDTLARALALGVRNGHRTGLLLIDLNGFKQINDTLGHQAGDELLVHFAALLRRCVLGADTVGRLGGDEFVVILHGDSDLAQARAVADRVTAAMTEPVAVGGTIVQPAASIGAAVTAPGELTAEQLLHQADLAMYGNKRRVQSSRS